MIRELERAVLLVDLPEHGLKKGDMGTVVLVHRGGEGYTVEFITLAGDTVAVVTLDATRVGPATLNAVSHARALGRV